MPDPGEPTTAGDWLADWVPTANNAGPVTAGHPPTARVTGRQVQRRLDAELTTVRAEQVRVDAKTSTLLSLAGVLLGGGLAVLGSAGRTMPVAAAVLAWTAAAAVGAAVVALAVAVRPNLRGHFGFVRWCRTRDAQQLLDELTGEAAAADPLTTAAGQLRWLSCALVAKYTAVRRAVTLLVAGLGGAAIAAAATMWTR